MYLQLSASSWLPHGEESEELLGCLLSEANQLRNKSEALCLCLMKLSVAASNLKAWQCAAENEEEEAVGWRKQLQRNIWKETREMLFNVLYPLREIYSK
jgi:hypothetical protein